MPSTSTSETILSVERLNLVFYASVHRSWTWKDAFTRLSSDPLGTLLSEKDRLHVARDFTFDVKRGDRIGLIGVNGAGKTSLCKCIAGLYAPTTGKMKRNGQVRAIFDTSVGVNPELTGRENARLLAEFMYPFEDDREAIVTEALEFSELGKFIDMPYKLYSNGMQTRLCLSLVSGRPCDLLVLDEVFDGADAYFKSKISVRVKKMIERSGAVIFVSHSDGQIREVCNRVILLDQGRIVHDGDVTEGLRIYTESTRQRLGQ